MSDAGDWELVSEVGKMAESIVEAKSDFSQEILEKIFENDTDEDDVGIENIQETDLCDNDSITSITESSLEFLLHRLSLTESNIESEQQVAASVNQFYSSNTCNELFKEFVNEIRELLHKCYKVKSQRRNKRLRAVEIEKNFYEERAKCCSLNEVWMKILTSASLERTDATDAVLQHILQHFWSTIGSKPEIDNAKFNIYVPSSLKNPDEMELLAIKDHAGWAIKRARDIVKSCSEDQLKMKQSPRDNSILDVDRKQALDLIIQLGKDEKQQDGHYRFIPNDNVCPLFTLLHDLTENLLSKQNIYSQGSKVVTVCLQNIATNKELRKQWCSLVYKYDFSQQVNIFILENICTMFVKSKQQIIREKFALKPQKGSSALREDLKGKVVKSSKQNPKATNAEQCSSQAASLSKTKSTLEVISELRQNFESSETVSHCLQKIAKEPNSKDLLSCLTGKELTKLLLSLGKPGLDGKKKSRQIDILLTGNLEVKYPEKVSSLHYNLKAFSNYYYYCNSAKSITMKYKILNSTKYKVKLKNRV